MRELRPIVWNIMKRRKGMKHPATYAEEEYIAAKGMNIAAKVMQSLIAAGQQHWSG